MTHDVDFQLLAKGGVDKKKEKDFTAAIEI